MSLVNIPQNPAPENAHAGHFQGFDGKPIRYAYWEATTPEPKGTICLFSGRTEYIEKYYEVIQELLSRGFAVSVMDWRGQGGSVRMLDNSRKGHIRRFSDFEDDAKIYFREIVEPNCPRPYYGLGHSMGGNLLLRLCSMEECPVEKAVLSSPMFGISKTATPLPLGVVKNVSSVLKLLGMGGSYMSGGSNDLWDCRPFETNQITTDKTRYDRSKATIEASPDLGIADPTNGWVNAAAKSMLEVRNPSYLSRIKIPVYILTSGSDEITDNPSAEYIANNLPNATYKEIPEAAHELMMENDGIRKQFWEEFDSFIPA